MKKGDKIRLIEQYALMEDISDVQQITKIEAELYGHNVYWEW